MDIEIYGPKLARSLMWSRHAFREHCVTSDVFINVFKQIYDTLEKYPAISLASVAEQILVQLERK